MTVSVSFILQYVKDTYTTLTLPELAAKFGYSESQIARIIKKYTGFTYSTYVMTLRINTATFLLKSTKYTVAQIAETVGIKSPEYFCRLYKKQVGYSPIQHKKYMYNEVDKGHKIGERSIPKHSKSFRSIFSAGSFRLLQKSIGFSVKGFCVIFSGSRFLFSKAV